MFRVLLVISAAAGLATGANAYVSQQSTLANGTSFNGMSMQGIELQGIELQGIELQGMTMQGVNMQGREIGTPSNSPIAEEISLPTGEKFQLR